MDIFFVFGMPVLIVVLVVYLISESKRKKRELDLKERELKLREEEQKRREEEK